MSLPREFHLQVSGESFFRYLNRINKTSYCGKMVNALEYQQCILEYYSREKTRLNC